MSAFLSGFLSGLSVSNNYDFDQSEREALATAAKLLLEPDPAIGATRINQALLRACKLALRYTSKSDEIPLRVDCVLTEAIRQAERANAKRKAGK